MRSSPRFALTHPTQDYELLMMLHAKPSTKVLSEQELQRAMAPFRAEADQRDACTVCLSSMSAGEELCRVACSGGHVFHRHCVAQWLQTASRCCPTCQHDLSAGGGVAGGGMAGGLNSVPPFDLA